MYSLCEFKKRVKISKTQREYCYAFDIVIRNTLKLEVCLDIKTLEIASHGASPLCCLRLLELMQIDITKI